MNNLNHKEVVIDKQKACNVLDLSNKEFSNIPYYVAGGIGIYCSKKRKVFFYPKKVINILRNKRNIKHVKLISSI